jgi:hypothetical protein
VDYFPLAFIPSSLSSQMANPSFPSGSAVTPTGFRTNGSLDWVGAMTKAGSLGRYYYTRLSGAFIDLGTMTSVCAIGEHFRMLEHGRRNVQKALSGLRSLQLYGQAISVGFDVEDVVQISSKTPQGIFMVALASALGITFHVSYAADVFYEISEQMEMPGQYKISGMHWEYFIRAAAGVLRSSAFPDEVNKFMQFGEPHSEAFRLCSDHLTHIDKKAGCPSSKALAAALLAISEIPSGKSAVVFIRGCPASAWIIAFSEWVIGLTVALSHEGNDAPIYCSEACRKNPALAQVQLIFDGGSDSDASTKAVVKGHVYRLDDASDFINNTILQGTINIASGTLPWDICLSSFFRRDFQEVMKRSSTLGTGLGSVAYLFKLLAIGDPNFPRREIHLSRSYFTAASGLDFIYGTTQQFPELLRTRDDALMTFDNCDSFTKAKAEYQGAVADLAQGCKCKTCSDTDTKRAYCFVRIFETIVVIAQSLSGIQVDVENMHPMRRGFESYYKRQCEIHLQASHTALQEKIGPVIFVLETNEEPNYEGTYWQHAVPNQKRILDAVRLFSGCPFEIDSVDVSAISTRDGICVYLDTLRQLSTDRESIDKVHVIPGKIEYNEKPYNSISDNYGLQSDWNWTEDAITGHHNFVTPSLLISTVRRTVMDGLSVAYDLLSAEGKHSYIQPSDFVDKVSRSRGRIHCMRRLCRHFTSLPVPREFGSFVEYGRGSRKVEILRTQSTLAACSLLAEASFDDDSYTTHCLLIENEPDTVCMHCAITEAEDRESHTPAQDDTELPTPPAIVIV